MLNSPSDGFLERYIHSVLERQYETKMISSGANYPSISLRAEHRGDLCVLLHHGLPPDVIQSYFGWSEQDLEERLDALLNEELLRSDPQHGYLPTFMIMTIDSVGRHLPVPESWVEETAQLVIAHLPEIMRRYSRMGGFKQVPFQAASLLILSNVMLDNWQINSIERMFVKAKRPLRNGMRYYYSIHEKAPWQPTEAFGIYGNRYQNYGPFTVGIYGNRREESNFITLTPAQLKTRFGESGPDTSGAYKKRILETLVRCIKGDGPSLPEAHRAGFEALGFMEENRITVPILFDEDQRELPKMAGQMTGDLVALLETYRADLRQFYDASPYPREVRFEEYVIWWYHLFYSAVTDMLTASGHITKPPTGIVSYLMVPP